MTHELDVDGPLVSVIVTTYNWPAALDLVLDGLSRQTYTKLEIIVADDGSGSDTEAVIARRAAESSVPILHSWQEDQGFRRARSSPFCR